MEEFIFVEIKPVESYLWSIVLLYRISNVAMKEQNVLKFIQKT